MTVVKLNVIGFNSNFSGEKAGDLDGFGVIADRLLMVSMCIGPMDQFIISIHHSHFRVKSSVLLTPSSEEKQQFGFFGLDIFGNSFFEGNKNFLVLYFVVE